MYENKYILSQIESIKDKNVLDLGCGAGEASVYFALNGANVFGIDISRDNIENKREDDPRSH